ncbi:putative tubulin polyglutamylase ttll9, partial [Quaeritorhiza haematococci]
MATSNVGPQQQPQQQLVRFRTGLRNTVSDVMKDRGWREVDSESDWDFFWADVHWVHENFDHMYLQEYQRINHYRNHYELTRKDLLVKNVKRMIKTIEKEHGKHESAKFEFISTSYTLPQEHALFQEEFKRQGGRPGGSVWIMKPVGRAQGKGIFLINRMSQIAQWRKDPRIFGSGGSIYGGGGGSNNSLEKAGTSPNDKKELAERNGYSNGKERDSTTSGGSGGDVPDTPEAYIVQRYIDNPYLVGDIHATNVAIQKTSPNYDGDKGCKWLLRNLKMYLSTKHPVRAVEELFTEMEALMVRALMSVQK